jgi:peptidoglycan/LPS O-acetylase OafA/YrhL
MRIAHLDILRGVAILLVLGRHIDSCPIGQPYPFYLAMRLWQRCGWIGVDLFFVLSGFLVWGLLFREYKQHGNIRLSRFFVRPCFRRAARRLSR